MTKPMQCKSKDRIDDIVDSDDEPPPLHAGSGACSVDGCHCPMFDGEYEICGHCGHDRDLHS